MDASPQDYEITTYRIPQTLKSPSFEERIDIILRGYKDTEKEFRRIQEIADEIAAHISAIRDRIDGLQKFSRMLK